LVWSTECQPKAKKESVSSSTPIAGPTPYKFINKQV
jgi:hypothetical protein